MRASFEYSLGTNFRINKVTHLKGHKTKKKQPWDFLFNYCDLLKIKKLEIQDGRRFFLTNPSFLQSNQ